MPLATKELKEKTLFSTKLLDFFPQSIALWNRRTLLFNRSPIKWDDNLFGISFAIRSSSTSLAARNFSQFIQPSCSLTFLLLPPGLKGWKIVD